MSVKAIAFTNWTDEDFTHTWNSVEYDFKAGQTVMLESYLANHFAKHLADRECNKKGYLTNGPEKAEFVRRSLGESVEARDSAHIALDVQQAKEEVREEVKPEPPTPKAKKASKKATREEETFEGLSE